MSSKPDSSPGSDRRAASQATEKDDLIGEDLSKLPAHIQSVRDGLLDFKNFMGLQAAMLIAEEDDGDIIPLSAYKSDGEGKLERARESDFVESAQLLAAYAQSVDGEEGPERNRLFRVVMTGRMENTCSGSNVHKNIAWADNGILSSTATATSDPPKSPIKTSMPGLHFGFSVQKADQRPVAGFRNDPSFDNYTRERLSRLATQGLDCSFQVPSSVDDAMAQTNSKEPQPQSVCFPWAIFEAYSVLKSAEENDISFANAVSEVSAAASSALSMFERLAKFADEKHDGQHIPPVIAITSVGANATVWLAYFDVVNDKIRDHKMINIWEGTITKIWDAVQFCRIMDNLFFWAQHCLKPKVTQYLSQWRLRYCPDVPNIYSRLEKDTRTAELIHQTQDHLSSLGLSPNEDLPALVRQAVVFQEVMRSSNKEVKSYSTPQPKEEKKLPVPAAVFQEVMRSSNEEVKSDSTPKSKEEKKLPVPAAVFQEAMRSSNEEAKSDSTPREEKKLPATAISLPSRRRDIDFEARLSRLGVVTSWVEYDLKISPKGTERQDSDFLPRKSEKGNTEPFKPDNANKAQMKSPPKHQRPFLAFPDTGKESTGENSTVLGDTKAISTNVLTNKQNSQSHSPTMPEVDSRGNNKITSSPRQTKTSSAGERKGQLSGSSKDPDNENLNLVQRILRSMTLRVENGHVLSLEEQKHRNLDRLFKREKPLIMKNPSNSLSRTDSNKEIGADRQSSAPNPFVSQTFKFSFDPMLCLGLDIAGPRRRTIVRHGPYPTLGVGTVLVHIKLPLRIIFQSELRRVDLAHQPVIIEPLPPPPASPLRVKIPWKGKHIFVKLPPVSPASVSIKRKDDSSES